MNASENTPNPSDSNHAVAKKIFDRMYALRSPDESLVDAAALASYVARISGKPYVAKNIKKALLAAGCQPHIKATGRTRARWRYCDVLPSLRSFKTGRAEAVEWPDRADKLRDIEKSF